MKMKETEIAAPVVQWLTDQGWDVYQEVCAHGSVADIVGRLDTERGNTLIWIIETKTTMGLVVLDQAINWIQSANFVSIAVPKRKRSSSDRPRVIGRILSYYGIGMLEVDMERVRSRRGPDLHRRRDRSFPKWDEILCSEQKIVSAAGSSLGGYWTPFKATCRDLLKHVKRHPGCALKEAISELKHHYVSDASAISSLKTLIQEGVVPGIRCEYEGCEIRLYTEQTRAEQ